MFPLFLVSIFLSAFKLHKIADRMHDLRGFYYIWFIIFSQPLAIFQLLIQIFHFLSFLIVLFPRLFSFLHSIQYLCIASLPIFFGCTFLAQRIIIFHVISEQYPLVEVWRKKKKRNQRRTDIRDCFCYLVKLSPTEMEHSDLWV